MAYTTAQRGLAHRSRPSLLSFLFRAGQVRRQRAHLSNLDDHMLRDIGLTREEVAAESRRVVWDVPQNWRS